MAFSKKGDGPVALVMVLVFDAQSAGRPRKPSSTTEGTAERLPPDFLRWLSESRSSLFEVMASVGAEAVRTQPSHLAVMATIDRDGGKINMATRGMGPVPRPEMVERYTGEFQSACREGDLNARINAARRFYSDHGLFDPSLLGGLEIFEGRTYNNLLKDPWAALLFTGDAPGYVSYQFDGPVSLVRPGDPYYEFLLQARGLFARDAFHLVQKGYPVGYLFRPVEVTVKTPYSRR
jgi:hypothetical protein